MARLPRYFLSDQPQHLIQRGNNRMSIFATESDYRMYLNCLHEAKNRYGCAIHAYVLMTNHVHMLLTPEHQDSIPQMMQSVGRKYVQYFNRSYQRTGTLWEGRYRATLIDSERYLLTCYRYIELNPVRAGMVSKPEDYPWSSYAYHAKGVPDRLVTDHVLYQALGQSSKNRQDAYRQLFAQEIPSDIVNAIRETTNKAWVLGGDGFRAAIAAMVKRRVDPLPKGRPRSSK